MGPRRVPVRMLGVALALVLSAAACDGEGGEADAGRLAASYDLSGVSLTVGSKEFTEQRILGHIAIQALEAAGADVTDATGLDGTRAARQALTSGEIDLYWEYTGAAWTQFLGEPGSPDSSQAYYEQVRRRDRRQHGIVWLDPAPLDNSYRIATSRRVAGDTGVETLSGYAQLVDARPRRASLCASTAFASRDDGLAGLQDHYGFAVPDAELVTIQLGAIYQAVANRDPCDFGSVFATDGRIATLDLVVLEDDRDFFAPYNPAVTMRQETLSRHGELADLFAEIAPLLDTETMRRLNRRVDTGGQLPKDVAHDFLTTHDLLS